MEVNGRLLVVNHPPSSSVIVGAGVVFGGGGLGGGVDFFSLTPVKLLSNAAILASNPGSKGSSFTTLVPFSSLVILILPVYPLLTVVDPLAKA